MQIYIASIDSYKRNLESLRSIAHPGVIRRDRNSDTQLSKISRQLRQSEEFARSRCESLDDLGGVYPS